MALFGLATCCLMLFWSVWDLERDLADLEDRVSELESRQSK